MIYEFGLLEWRASYIDDYMSFYILRMGPGVKKIPVLCNCRKTDSAFWTYDMEIPPPRTMVDPPRFNQAHLGNLSNTQSKTPSRSPS